VSFLGCYHFTAFCILDDSSIVVLWEEVSFYSPSNFVGLIGIAFPGVTLVFCNTLSLSRQMCGVSRIPFQALGWFGDTQSIL